MCRPCWSSRRNVRERGNIITELALALPLFLLFIAGGLDLGMLFYSKHIITNAAREGARAAAKSRDTGTILAAELTQTQVRTVVQNYLNQFSLKNLDGSALILGSGTFAYTWTSSGSGYVLTVSLTNIPCKLVLLPEAKTFFGGARTSGDDAFYLNAQTSMAAEWTTPPGS